MEFSRRVSSEDHIDMLNGPLMKKLLMFALPLFFSGILQQSFNSADIAVVGHWCGKNALAAVGNNGLIISFIVNLFVGISVGVNVVIANHIGRRDKNGIQRSISTSAFIAVVSGLFLFAVCFVSSRFLLKMVDTPFEVLDLAVLYLQIFSFGLPFMMIYNFGSAIMRSFGDTRRPFYALVIAGLVNVVLNLILVIIFGMGVAGVGIATVVSNIVSALLVIRFLIHEKPPYRLLLHDIYISRPDLREILRIGVPAGLQAMVFSVSNIFILASINGFGSDAAAGSSAALNYEYYCYFAISAFAQAAVAFISQNYGSGNIDRCKAIFRDTMLLSVVFCGIMNVTIVLAGDFFISLFSTSEEVIHYARIRLDHVLMFQFIACSYEISAASMRGVGYSLTPALLTVFGTCVIRLVWVWYFSLNGGSFGDLLYVYPVTWVITGIMVYCAYRIIFHRISVASRATSH